MNPTVFAARIDGTGIASHLSLHTSYEGAVNAVLRAGGVLHRDRFGYAPEDLRPLTERSASEYGATAAAALRKAEDRLFGAGGWIASVEELPVELDGADEDAHRERIAEDRDGERAGQPY
jgi:hypothetical protein